AQDILRAIAKDLREPQTGEQQDLKSKGLAPKLPMAAETAAQTHAYLRAGDGFNVNQLAAEYRALRSSVLRLWSGAQGPLDDSEVQDMIRFNEAIDQALAESIAVFSRRVSEARDLTLAMFGHDLRSPLGAIRSSALVLARRIESPELNRITQVIENACVQMSGLLMDLVDFNRVRLGLGLKVDRADVDLRKLCEDEVDLIRAAYPDRRIELVDGDGPCHGLFDAKRLQQLLGNLLVNAVSHGSAESPVEIRLACTPGRVELAVSNRGPTIPAGDLRRIFEPLKRAGNSAAVRDPQGSLGLGLYISHQIAIAHGGDIAVTSEDERTVFSTSLPRLRAE
ncbi:MAG: HAMP domain-containing histidine kinase, partial [Proteobacteria bacterium]